MTPGPARNNTLEELLSLDVMRQSTGQLIETKWHRCIFFSIFAAWRTDWPRRNRYTTWLLTRR